MGPQPVASRSSCARALTSSTVTSANGFERPPAKTVSASTFCGSGFGRVLIGRMAPRRPRPSAYQAPNASVRTPIAGANASIRLNTGPRVIA